MKEDVCKYNTHEYMICEKKKNDEDEDGKDDKNSMGLVKDEDIDQ
jgi:hypothetical protein